MRQILLNSGGAVVARVPRPAVERGAVLVRVDDAGTGVAPDLAGRLSDQDEVGIVSPDVVEQSPFAPVSTADAAALAARLAQEHQARQRYPSEAFAHHAGGL